MHYTKFATGGGLYIGLISRAPDTVCVA